eukprot:COSAG01_NODE_5048_length_4525_cov_43.153547_3_plen_150_part_00
MVPPHGNRHGGAVFRKKRVGRGTQVGPNIPKEGLKSSRMGPDCAVLCCAVVLCCAAMQCAVLCCAVTVCCAVLCAVIDSITPANRLSRQARNLRQPSSSRILFLYSISVAVSCISVSAQQHMPPTGHRRPPHRRTPSPARASTAIESAK